MSRELYIEEEECTGCQYCVSELPGVFKMEGGISLLFNQDGAAEAELQHVVDNCPAECILWK